MDRYPYFLYPVVSELRHNPDHQFARQLKQFIAVNIDDREALNLLFRNKEDSFSPTPSEARRGTDHMDIYIDSFISRFSNGTQPPVPEALIHPQGNKSNHAAEAPKKETTETRLKDSAPQSAVTESLDVVMERVKFMVKNRNYDAALQIMESFYLNNPKKSVYFADQIRFLRKLKLNESKK